MMTANTLNGTPAAALETDKVSIAPGSNVVVVRPTDAEEPATPEQIRAQTDMLAAFLTAPVVREVATGIIAALTSKASAEAEKAKAEVEKARIAADQHAKLAEDNNKRAFDFSVRFLYCLSATGCFALALVGVFAWTGALKDASLSAFAMFVVGSIFGGTIYGTTLRKQEKP